jgi:hypothetical protein
MFGPAYYGEAYFGPSYFGLGADGGATPTSLLAALSAYWSANDLDTSIAPLRAHGIHAGTAAPFVVIDKLDEVFPGPTPDDTPVEMFMTVWHESSDLARAASRAIQDHLGDPGEVPQAITRDPLTWTVGAEKFAERDSIAHDLTLRPYIGTKRAYRSRLHYRFWISGRP